MNDNEKDGVMVPRTQDYGNCALQTRFNLFFSGWHKTISVGMRFYDVIMALQ